MGPIDGFEATRLIRNFSPGSKILAVSMYVFPAYARKMKALGAMGYITKSSPVEELVTAMVEVSRGHFYFCEQIENIIRIEQKMYPEKKPDTVTLTNREIEVIQLIRNGLTSKQIAGRLYLSPKTINIHRHNIFRKLKVKNVTLLITTAQTMGF